MRSQYVVNTIQQEFVAMLKVSTASGHSAVYFRNSVHGRKYLRSMAESIWEVSMYYHQKIRRDFYNTWEISFGDGEDCLINEVVLDCKAYPGDNSDVHRINGNKNQPGQCAVMIIRHIHHAGHGIILAVTVLKKFFYFFSFE